MVMVMMMLKAMSVVLGSVVMYGDDLTSEDDSECMLVQC